MTCSSRMFQCSKPTNRGVPENNLTHCICLKSQWPQAGKDLWRFPGLWKFVSAVSPGLQLCYPKKSSVRALTALKSSASPSPLPWIWLPVFQACPDRVWLGNLGLDMQHKSYKTLGSHFFTEDLCYWARSLPEFHCRGACTQHCTTLLPTPAWWPESLAWPWSCLATADLWQSLSCGYGRSTALPLLSECYWGTAP